MELSTRPRLRRRPWPNWVRTLPHQAIRDAHVCARRASLPSIAPWHPDRDPSSIPLMTNARRAAARALRDRSNSATGQLFAPTVTLVNAGSSAGGNGLASIARRVDASRRTACTPSKMRSRPGSASRGRSAASASPRRERICETFRCDFAKLGPVNAGAETPCSWSPWHKAHCPE